MRWFVFALLVALGGCDQEGAARSGSELSIGLDTSGGTGSAFIVLRGLSRDELRALHAASAVRADSVWQALLRVTVLGAASVATVLPVVGAYTTSDSAVEFRPRFPFDAGRAYLVSVDPRRLGPARPESLVVSRFALPSGDRTPRTVVRAIYPGSDTVPENLLRLYIEFSAPMSRTGGLDFITLRDDRNQEVKAAFLPLEADFWNDDRTRYTAFLDPGRVKRGILPNEQMGRAIRNGGRYSVVVDSNWRDANGVGLAATFRRAFQVGAPDDRVIDLDAWRIESPVDATTQPLRVTFPKSLDHGLLQRALGVETADGTQVTGTVEASPDDREWRFVPNNPWRRGPYRVLVLSILEDPAGNRIDRPFEVDVFERVDRTPAPERRTIPFNVRSR